MKNNKLFREKSIERVSSPEALDRYLKVTPANVWISLIAIIVLLAGVIVWGFIGKIETGVVTGCSVLNGEMECYLKQEDAKTISKGMKIVLDYEGGIGQVESIKGLGYVSDINVGELMQKLDCNVGDYIFGVFSKVDVKDGEYSARIITDSISPIKFITN